MEFRRRHAMEAWRTGSDDLSLPEIAPLAGELEREPALRAECEAIQQEEQLFRSAMQEVQVPAGLADRLMAALQLKPKSEPSLLADVDVVGPAAPANADAPTPALRTTAAERPAPSSRFRFLLAAGALASVFLIAGLSLHFFSAPPLSGQVLIADAVENLPASEVLRGSKWNGDLEAVPGQLSFPGKAFRSEVAPLGWRDAGEVVPGAAGVVYRLTSSQRGQAYLLVLEVPAGVVGLDVSPNIEALRSTGGWVAGAWRDGNRVCLLLVEGGPERFRGMLKSEAAAA